MKTVNSYQVPRRKIATSAIISLAGAILFGLGIPVTEAIDQTHFITMLLGVFLIISGMLYAGIAISCPVCGSRLLLRNAPDPPFSVGGSRYWVDLARLLRPVMCPQCLDDLRTESERAEAGDMSERHEIAMAGRLVFGAWDLFLSTGLICIVSIVVTLGFYSPLIGGILLTTVGVMVVITIVWKLR